MEFQNVIEARRSMRKYDASKKVDEATIKTIIEAAILAPSWKNSQTARYYCITSEALVSQFKAECLPSFNANNAADAPVLIITTFVKNIAGFSPDGEPTNELGNGWGFYDLGLHNQNLILKAQDLGLDTLIMGIRDANKIREMLSISEDEIIVAVIAVGYADQEARKPPRKAADEILKFFS
ncbi:MAG: nitroreductase family protein [Acetobacterium sp.]|nr:nitroreductase family protein [Acetobacterium sp.]